MSDDKEKSSVESKHLSVYKSDIKKIGHTTLEEYGEGNKPNGKTCFACLGKTANIEEILLREILILYGYKIVSSWDCISTEDEGNDVVFNTDMPWYEYRDLPF